MSHHIDIGTLYETPPPANLDAERALIRSMLIGAGSWAIGDIVKIIDSPEDFSDANHVAIYKTAVRLFSEKGYADITMVKHALVGEKKLDAVRCVDALIAVHETAPPAEFPFDYARIVKNTATTRRIIEAAGLTLYDCYNENLPPTELLDRAEARLRDIRGGMAENQVDCLKDLLERQMKLLDERDGQGMVGLSTGFRDLDEMTDGFQPGDLIVIASRPLMGKTAFMLSVARHMAIDSQVPIAMFSMESNKNQLGQRLLCSHVRVDAQRFKKNALDKLDFAAIQEAFGQLADIPMYIDDVRGLSLMQIRAKARQLVVEHGVKAVFLDGLQLLNEPDARQTAHALKALARELKVPVVCLATLGHYVDDYGSGDYRPRLFDFKELEGVVQEADVVALLHREEYYHKPDGGRDWHWREEQKSKQRTNDPSCLFGYTELAIVKQLNGATGSIGLHLDNMTNLLKDTAKTEDDAVNG